MPETSPRSSQVTFASAKTGEHNLDTYLETAEKGTRTLPDLLDDIFDAQGVLIPFGFRDYRGDWSTATVYVRGDVVRDPTNSNFYLVQTDHTAAAAIAADVTATNLVLLFDAEAAALAAGGVPASRTLTAGTGLIGGGDLSADRTLALDAATQASLNKADTALQPGAALVPADIGGTVQAYFGPVDTTTPPTNGEGLVFNGTTWVPGSVGADFSAVAENILPDADSTRSLGSAGFGWAATWSDTYGDPTTGKAVDAKYVTDGAAKASINFNGTGVVSVRGSLNSSSITDNGTGDYTNNFTSAFANANYVLTNGIGDTGSKTAVGLYSPTTHLSGSNRGVVCEYGWDMTFGANYYVRDRNYMMWTYHGDLA